MDSTKNAINYISYSRGSCCGKNYYIYYNMKLTKSYVAESLFNVSIHTIFHQYSSLNSSSSTLV